MKLFEIQEFGIDNLALVERDVPKPGANQVLVKMAAASLNFRRLYDGPRSLQSTIEASHGAAFDGSGVVEEVGPDCNPLQERQTA